MKVATIVGARPQFIKAAAVSRIIRKNNTEILIHTGQHYDANMSSIFFDELHIPNPDYNLGIGSSSHAKQTGEMMEGIEDILLKEKPDIVLVYGDTNSTLAGALSAVKIHFPVAHIEAGLRSFNRDMPEEINRIVTDHVSSYLFCPTQTAIENLKQEGIVNGVFEVGDVMLDAIDFYKNIILKKTFSDFSNRLIPIANTTTKIQNQWYFATIHRAENSDEIGKILNILIALNQLDYPVIFPVHPRIRIMILSLMSSHQFSNILFCEPIGYLESLFFTSRAIKVITDSGGLQKEAYIFDVPCVTVRDQTEWIETLAGNLNILAKPSTEDILDKVYNTKVEKSRHTTCYGDGHSSEKIVSLLEKGYNR